MTLKPQIKLLLDILPLVVFFICYKWFGLFVATGSIIITSLLSLLVIYFFEKKIALSPLISALVVAIFGSLTLYLHDEIFIKIKPTLVNLVFAAVLLGGCLSKKGLLRHIFGQSFNLSERGWFLLSRRWGFFFIFMAGLNELVWRNFPTDTWVNFKVFGLIGLTVLFATSQMRFILKHQKID